MMNLIFAGIALLHMDSEDYHFCGCCQSIFADIVEFLNHKQSCNSIKTTVKVEVDSDADIDGSDVEDNVQVNKRKQELVCHKTTVKDEVEGIEDCVNVQVNKRKQKLVCRKKTVKDEVEGIEELSLIHI